MNDQLLPGIRASVNTQRLLDTAVRLIEIPSPTRSGGDVADGLASILSSDGFDVERPECGWPDAPAVVARYDSGQPGPTLQFNGHLDTVHLPFVAPRVEDGMLYGSGSSDMKGGVAAAAEAMRAVRDSGILTRGSILLTAHDLHEFPWGDGSQIDGLIDAGYVGDAVMLPEYCHDPLPIAGRGLAVLKVAVTRDGDPVHEVLGGYEQPNIVRAGAEIVRELMELNERVSANTHPVAGHDSVFVGQIHSGEIFNQSPTRLELSGTRRWVTGADADSMRAEFADLLDAVASRFGVMIGGEFQYVRDAFEIDPGSGFVEAFQQAHRQVTGRQLSLGAKPFVDDGNTFVHRAGIPAITHGPDATGAHTLNEQVPVAELVRVAEVYALTAACFCGDGTPASPRESAGTH